MEYLCRSSKWPDRGGRLQTKADGGPLSPSKAKPGNFMGGMNEVGYCLAQHPQSPTCTLKLLHVYGTGTETGGGAAALHAPRGF